MDKNLAFVLKRIIYFPDNILTDDNINKKTTYVPKINRFILLNTNIFPYFLPNIIKNDMKKRILILDDKETIAKVLSIYLMAEYDCIWLQDGVQGMKWLQEGNLPDLIISDIRMPEMRGDDFLEWIKANELFKHIPVIMLSSEDSTTERIRLLEIGAEDYIVKPFNPMELKIRVKKIIE